MLRPSGANVSTLGCVSLTALRNPLTWAALLGRVGSDRSTVKLHPSIFPWTTCRWAPSRAARFRLPSLRASSWARLSFVKFPELVVVTSLPALVWDYHEQLNH